MLSTGVTQASVLSNTSAHSSRVRVAKGREQSAQLCPLAPVVAVRQGREIEAEPRDCLGVELLLDRAERDVATVGAGP